MASVHENRPPNGQTEELQALRAEQRATREELAALNRRFDDFARVYLAARFPFGKPNDRWSRQ